MRLMYFEYTATVQHTMGRKDTEEVPILANNIKVLRKKYGYSQEQLSSLVGIKRSNIAAYESKGVEPRLRIILEIAKVFDISIKDLIQRRLSSPDEVYTAFTRRAVTEMHPLASLGVPDVATVKSFEASTIQTQKVIEGFKAFYSIKKRQLDKNADPMKARLLYDIDNFLDLMEQLLTYNQSLMDSLSTWVGDVQPPR